MYEVMDFSPESPYGFFYGTVTSDDINKALITNHDGIKRGKTKVCFLTHYVAHGDEQLVVVGSIHELGHWDCANGALAYPLDAPGWWLATIDIPKTKSFCFQWKWAVRSADGHSVLRWEERSNRILYPLKRHHFIIAPWFEDSYFLKPDCPITKGALCRDDRVSRLFHPSDSPYSTLDRDSDSSKLVRRHNSIVDRFRTFIARRRHKSQSSNTSSVDEYDKTGTM